MGNRVVAGLSYVIIIPREIPTQLSSKHMGVLLGEGNVQEQIVPVFTA